MESEYPFTVKVYNVVQYCNIISSTTVGAGVSLWLFVGLLHNRANSGLNHYRDMILILSAIYFLTCLATIPLLPAVSLPRGDLVFLLGKYFPIWFSYCLAIVVDSLTKYGNELLAAAIIYKVTSLVRPDWINRAKILLAILVIPPPIIQLIFDPQSRRSLSFNTTCDLYCVDTDRNSFPTAVHLIRSVEDSSNVTSNIDYGAFIFVVIAVVPGVAILENWFRTGNFSPKTLKLQRKLSKAWIILMLVHGFIFLPQLALWLVHALPRIPGISLQLLLLTISIDLNYWVIPIKTLVIFFSVRKLLHTPDWIKNWIQSTGENNNRSIIPI